MEDLFNPSPSLLPLRSFHFAPSLSSCCPVYSPRLSSWFYQPRPVDFTHQRRWVCLQAPPTTLLIRPSNPRLHTAVPPTLTVSHRSPSNPLSIGPIATQPPQGVCHACHTACQAPVSQVENPPRRHSSPPLGCTTTSSTTPSLLTVTPDVLKARRQPSSGTALFIPVTFFGSS